MTMDLAKVFKSCGFNKVDEKLAQDLNKIITWQEKLKQIPIDNIEPMYNTLGDDANYISNDDNIEKENSDVLANAPETEDNFFLVPKVIKN